MSVFAIVYMNYETFQDTRPIVIIEKINSYGLYSAYLIAYYDHSINARLGQLIIPFFGFIENFGMPGGYYTFPSIATEFIDKSIFIHSESAATSRIGSFIGVFVYELGLLGFVILLIMASILKKENNWKFREIIILYVSLLPAVPLGMAIVPLLFGSKINKIKT